MKKNETALTLFLNYHCKYSHLVKGCYSAFYSCCLYRTFKVYKNLSYPYILEGDLYSKGTKFMLRRPDIGVIMFYEIKDYLMTDYYSRFTYNIYKTIPETFNYIHLIEIRYINEDECEMRSSIIYNNNIFLSEEEFQKSIKFKMNLYKAIETSLRNFIILKVTAAYTNIKCNIELVFNILKNMKMIHKYTHLLADKINYDGNILKKDDIIELIYKKGKIKIKTFAKVNRLKLNKMALTKEGTIELLFQKIEENNPLAKTKIIIRINEFEGKCSMYILFHFLKAQNSYDLKIFSQKKDKELQIFKDIVENYIKNNKINEFNNKESLLL